MNKREKQQHMETLLASPSTSSAVINQNVIEYDKEFHYDDFLKDYLLRNAERQLK